MAALASPPAAAAGQQTATTQLAAAEPVGAEPAATEPAAPESRAVEPAAVGRLNYAFEGQTRTVRSAIEVVLEVVRTLAQRDPTFCERFAPEAAGRRRNHVARRPEDVYPGQPQLVKYVAEIVPGWYIGTNISNRDKTRLLEAACKIAGLKFGADLVVDLPNAKS